MASNLRLASLAAWVRSILSRLLGLFTLMVLSIALVWPVWYVATNHTRLYSFAMLLLLGALIVSGIQAKLHKHFMRVGRHGMKTVATGKPQPGPTMRGE